MNKRAANHSQNEAIAVKSLQTIAGSVSMRTLTTLVAATIMALSLIGCSPTVKVQAPSEPIAIDLNVKIQHEVKVKVEKEVDELFTENKDLF